MLKVYSKSYNTNLTKKELFLSLKEECLKPGKQSLMSSENKMEGVIEDGGFKMRKGFINSGFPSPLPYVYVKYVNQQIELLLKRSEMFYLHFGFVALIFGCSIFTLIDSIGDKGGLIFGSILFFIGLIMSFYIHHFYKKIHGNDMFIAAQILEKVLNMHKV